MNLNLDSIKNNTIISRKNSQDEKILKLLQIVLPNEKKIIKENMKKFCSEIEIYIPSKLKKEEIKNILLKLIENTLEGGWNLEKLKEYVRKEKLDVRTRDHSKCEAAEILVKKLLKNTDSFILNNTKYYINHSTIKKGSNDTPTTVKNDCMFEIKNELGDIFLYGIQIKKLKNEKSKEKIIFHNWRHKKQRKDVENHKDTKLEEREIIEKDFKNGCNEIYSHPKKWEKNYQDYIKSESRPKQKKAKLVKFSMQVSDKPSFEDSNEIKSLQLKKHYIRHLYNPVHNFYHLKIYENDLSNKNITLQELIDRMVLMDDKEIENFKLYWSQRPIYSTSGKTQNDQEDFLKLFSKTDSSSFIDEINNTKED